MGAGLDWSVVGGERVVGCDRGWMGALLDVSVSLDVGGWLDGSVVGCERVVGWERGGM